MEGRSALHAHAGHAGHHDHHDHHDPSKFGSFDKFAATYDSKFASANAYYSDAIAENLDWFGVDWKTSRSAEGHQVKILDYGCGTGMVSRALSPHATQVIAIDSSATMVAAYTRAAQSLPYASQKIAAFHGDLVTSPEAGKAADNYQHSGVDFSTPQFFDFDLVVCCMALHHFPQPATALARLAARARQKGGVVVIVDMLPAEMPAGIERHAHESGDGTVLRRGFGGEEEVKALFEGAGVGKGFGYFEVDRPLVLDLEEGERWEAGIWFARGETG